MPLSAPLSFNQERAHPTRRVTAREAAPASALARRWRDGRSVWREAGAEGAVALAPAARRRAVEASIEQAVAALDGKAGARRVARQQIIIVAARLPRGTRWLPARGLAARLCTERGGSTLLDRRETGAPGVALFHTGAGA